MKTFIEITDASTENTVKIIKGTGVKSLEKATKFMDDSHRAVIVFRGFSGAFFKKSDIPNIISELSV
jgi:hypothetical protein